MSLLDTQLLLIFSTTMYLVFGYTLARLVWAINSKKEAIIRWNHDSTIIVEREGDGDDLSGRRPALRSSIRGEGGGT